MPLKEELVTETDRKNASLERKARITRFACLIGMFVFAFLTAGSWGLYIISSRSPARLVGGIVCFLAFAASLVAFLLQRRGQNDLANWILLAILLTIGVVPSFMFSGTGLLAALVFLSLAVILASTILHDNQILFFIAAGLVSLLVSQLAETFGPTSRPIMMQPAAATTVSIIMAVVLILVLALRFRSFPFRAKIIVSLFGLTAFAILVVAAASAYISSQSMTKEGFCPWNPLPAW